MATEQDWVIARRRARRAARRNALAGIIAVGVLGCPAVLVADVEGAGAVRYLVTSGWLMLMLAPVVVARRNLQEQNRTDTVVATLTEELTHAVSTANRQAAEREALGRGQKFESRLINALDLAEGEPEVIDVVERAFALIAPRASVELLLADNSHAHLLRMAQAPVSTDTPGCGVDSPHHCPAARRAQVQRFADSEELDACPKLRGRSGGAVSALCVPVAIMGRTVGVIHATGAQHHVFPDTIAQDLENLAKVAGSRIGLLRVMAETALQAATDSLTGLLNRRSFEQQYLLMRRESAMVTVAMADLDHFKLLNDKYGHETGDRALRLFSQVLSESVRTADLVGRHGGEEFVLALTDCPVERVRVILDKLRERLDAAITVAGLPQFTASFGLVQAQPGENLSTVLTRADAALFQAKHDGRNQIVIHDVADHLNAPVADLNCPAPTELDQLRGHEPYPVSD